jgi:hypothetical protein
MHISIYVFPGSVLYLRKVYRELTWHLIVHSKHISIPALSLYVLYDIVQGFGSGSAWIRIHLSCWIRIRIQVYKLRLNFEEFFKTCELVLLTFFLMKRKFYF